MRSEDLSDTLNGYANCGRKERDSYNQRSQRFTLPLPLVILFVWGLRDHSQAAENSQRADDVHH
jgi:hypothetical protein